MLGSLRLSRDKDRCGEDDKGRQRERDRKNEAEKKGSRIGRGRKVSLGLRKKKQKRSQSLPPVHLNVGKEKRHNATRDEEDDDEINFLVPTASTWAGKKSPYKRKIDKEKKARREKEEMFQLVKVGDGAGLLQKYLVDEEGIGMHLLNMQEDKKQRTMLHYAVENGDVELVTALIELSDLKKQMDKKERRSKKAGAGANVKKVKRSTSIGAPSKKSSKVKMWMEQREGAHRLAMQEDSDDWDVPIEKSYSSPAQRKKKKKKKEEEKEKEKDRGRRSSKRKDKKSKDNSDDEGSRLPKGDKKKKKKKSKEKEKDKEKKNEKGKGKRRKSDPDGGSVRFEQDQLKTTRSKSLGDGAGGGSGRSPRNLFEAERAKKDAGGSPSKLKKGSSNVDFSPSLERREYDDEADESRTVSSRQSEKRSDQKRSHSLSPRSTQNKHLAKKLKKKKRSRHYLNLNMQDLEGQTPLHLCCRLGDGEMIALLLAQKKCNVKLRDNRGYSALHHLIANFPISSKVRNFGKKLSRYSQLGMKLITKGCDPTWKNNEGDTALHIAAGRGSAAAIRFLLRSDKWKVEINAFNNNGETALHMAVRQGSTESVNALLESGIDESAISKYGTALDVARECKHVEIVRLLVKRLSSIGRRDAKLLGFTHSVSGAEGDEDGGKVPLSQIFRYVLEDAVAEEEPPHMKGSSDEPCEEKEKSHKNNKNKKGKEKKKEAKKEEKEGALKRDTAAPQPQPALVSPINSKDDVSEETGATNPALVSIDSGGSVRSTMEETGRIASSASLGGGTPRSTTTSEAHAVTPNTPPSLITPEQSPTSTTTTPTTPSSSPTPTTTTTVVLEPAAKKILYDARRDGTPPSTPPGSPQSRRLIISEGVQARGKRGSSFTARPGQPRQVFTSSPSLLSARSMRDKEQKEKEEKDKKKKEAEEGQRREEEMTAWLKGLNLPETYCALFMRDGFDDLDTIKLVSEADLINIGISQTGHRKKIMHWVINNPAEST